VARRFVEPRLVLATHNPGKLAELRELLAGRPVEVLSSTALGLPEPVEDGPTFAANAALKARTAMQASHLPALADDSGLVVHGLDGRPGVHSARWAGPEGDFGRAMARVRDELRERFGSFAMADRRAEFVAVLCLAGRARGAGRGPGRGPDRRPAARPGRLRLRSDLPAAGRERNLRRDAARGETGAEPSRPGAPPVARAVLQRSLSRPEVSAPPARR
jgi:non-canonical purine NTP pyrophosphatase (RdgB/HAM1 family)